jgi:hypothetical protein
MFSGDLLPVPFPPGAPFMQSHCSVSSHEWAIARKRDPLRLRARLQSLP